MTSLSTPYDIAEIYRAFLGREPESNLPYESFSGVSAVRAARIVAESPEFRSRVGLHQSPFWHVNACVDVHRIVERHVNPDRAPLPDHIVNFLGVAMHVRFMPHVADRAGTLDEIPIPANYHADMAEWASALRAVELADQSFSMIELGCGWGCWMNNTAMAAKRRGLAVHVIGIEGDDGHIEFARESLATNNVRPEEFTLHRGVATANSGIALFPRQGAAGQSWGLEPVFAASAEQRAEAVATGQYDELQMIPLAEAIGDRQRIDLLHIDIQGEEVDLVRDTLPLLSEKVAYIFIGTHSREIEGQLMHDLFGAGWNLEIERPAIFQIVDGKPLTTVDGSQGWINPRLASQR